MRRTLATALAIVAGFGVALPPLHLAFRPPGDDARASPRGGAPSSTASSLLAAQLDAWGAGRREVARTVNPEWDLGHRTFFVLALVDRALVSPAAERDTYRVVVDEALADVGAQSAEHYHLPYFHGGALRQRGAGSLFMEGEIVMMQAARLVAFPDPSRNDELEARAARVFRSMNESPVLMAESYPDECWMFDNTLALASLVVARRALGHPVAGAEDLTRRWLAAARDRIDPHTGLLVASTTWDGDVLDGPEGSSSFAVAHFLDLVDPALARDQYERAKAMLVVRPFGFAYAREWPDSTRWGDDPRPPRAGIPDVDSGPIVPGLGASAGASGMAFLGANAFGDEPLVNELSASLELAAFPDRQGGRLRFLASNTLGDAVLLYALSQKPLWDLVRGREVAS